MASVPYYKKIGGLWYTRYITTRTKAEAKSYLPRRSSNSTYAYRIVKLARSYCTAKRHYAIYRRGKERGVIYNEETPSPSNPTPKRLKQWLSKSKDSYKIIRFRLNGKNRTIKKGLTLKEAQKHCSKESTHGNGWFDGYDKE